jgi:hypothetical protein
MISLTPVHFAMMLERRQAFGEWANRITAG